MSSFESLYHEVEMNVREAVYRFKKLNSQNDELRRENERLREELSDLRKKLEDKEEKLKLVELTGTILEREDKTDLKKQINDWVREIDNSIKLLSGK